MYCTEKQMTERFGARMVAQLTSRDGSDRINRKALDSAIADATAEINMHLAGRYALPLSTVPLPLTRIACILARDILAVNSDINDERWRDQAADARKMLHDISTGRVSLGVDAAARPPVASDGGVQMVSGGRIWGRDKSGGFM